MWRSFFRHVGTLSSLHIGIRDSSESPEAAHAITQSSFWLDYASLLRGSETLYDLIPAAKVTLSFNCIRHNHAYSDFLQRVLNPLKSYPDVEVVLRLANENDELETPRSVQLAELLSSTWVNRLSIWTESQIHLLPAFDNIRTIKLWLKTEAITATFWRHFELASRKLHNLRITELDLPELTNLALRKTLSIPTLKRIEADGFTVSTIAQLAKLSSMPALRSIKVNLDCRDQDPDYEHLYESIIMSLQSLARLNDALSKHCPKNQRIYNVLLDGDLQDLRGYLQVLAPLASTSTLSLTVTCSLDCPSSLMNLEDIEDPPYCDAAALAVAFAPEIRPSVKSLVIKLDSDAISRLRGGEEMAFPNLTDLTVTVPEDNSKWSTHVVHQLLTSLTLPKLVRLRLSSDAEMSVNTRFVEMLEIFLPLWPALRQLELETCCREDYEADLDISALKAACTAKNAGLTMLLY